MVRSAARSVDEYVEGFEGETRAFLEGMRAMAREVMPGFEESLQYGMPTYRSGERVFAFAVQKHHLSVYVQGPEAIREHAGRLGKHTTGKNCIRFRRPEDADLEGLRPLLREVYGGGSGPRA